jgi:hypothetical protein
MTHPLDIPDFLSRKLHPELNERELGGPKPRSLVREQREIVMPKATPKPVERDYGQLSAGEREELAEIKAMVKTNLVLAKRMATEWVNRPSVRDVQARRRHYLKTVKGLQRRA